MRTNEKPEKNLRYHTFIKLLTNLGDVTSIVKAAAAVAIAIIAGIVAIAIINSLQ